MLRQMEREIVGLIEKVVRERFADVAIDRILINREHDYDGDDVFRVTVVFDRKASGPLDAHKTAAITRQLRHKLVENDEDAFPIFTFMSKADAAGMSSEAA